MDIIIGIIGNVVFSFLPDEVANNPYFWLGVIFCIAVLSELMALCKNPDKLPPGLKWLTKYNGIIQMVWTVLMAWKKKMPVPTPAPQSTVDSPPTQTTQSGSGMNLEDDPMKKISNP